MTPPTWVERVDRVLDPIARRIESARPTPTNFARELDRLTDAWTAGREASPAFEYGARVDLGGAREALEDARAAVDGGPLAPLYEARIDELAVEAELAACEALDRGRLAALRFGDRAGDALARIWIGAPIDAPEDDELVRSDDARHPRSLASLMRAALGRARIPARVAPTSGLAALAAYKDGVIFVAKDRMVGVRAARRTVHHEVAGHAAPAARAASSTIALPRLGAARGSDDQEGFALVLEARGGFLDGARRRELGARHFAATQAHAGAPFVEAARELLASGVPRDVALRAALRAYRGADAQGRGALGRERVYLAGYARVTSAFDERPELESTLSAGRLSVESARVLAGLGVKDRR